MDTSFIRHAAAMFLVGLAIFATPTARAITCNGANDGAGCDDGNACTQTDTCQNGVCVGSNPVTCTALDQCHSTGTCNPATGVCSNPTRPNGTACSDGDACTQADTCQAGVCSGNPVTCTAQDQCHAAGTCNPATGICSNPNKTDGTACNDGNACTQADTCQTGVCTGGSTVTCTALDQCHAAGTCNPATGTCSNPTRPNGTACSDGNACTQAGTCQAGVCSGGSPVTCTAQDQCHSAGTCNTSTGACSNPTRPDGTACSDGNACTQTDFCVAGVCNGSNPVTCTASDQCHSANCNPATGACANVAKADGTACNDGNSCTSTDVCVSGACSGTAYSCAPPNQCQQSAGSCNGDGTCSYANKVYGTTCDDGDPSNVDDICNNGVCAGVSFAVTGTSVSTGTFSVTFTTANGRHYSLEESTNLSGWSAINGSAFTGDGKAHTSNVNTPNNTGPYFVRVLVGP